MDSVVVASLFARQERSGAVTQELGGRLEKVKASRTK